MRNVLNMLLFWALIYAQAGNATSNDRVEQHLTAPGGRVTYYILTTNKQDLYGEPVMTISSKEEGKEKVLLKSRVDNDPKKNLTGFNNLYISPDSKTLFFNSVAWATSGAIHSLDIDTGAVKFVSAGELSCVVLGGEYQGNLIVQKHKYFVQGGSHDDLYLVTPAGKELGLASQGTDKSGVCPTSFG